MDKIEQRIEQIEKFASQCYEDGEKYSAFIAGAIWADNNPAQDVINFNDVWHNVTEEPQDKSHILIRYNYIGSVEFKSYHIDYQCDFKWSELVDCFGVECWAYISDLLRTNEMFGKSE